jgi:hypothetical protein
LHRRHDPLHLEGEGEQPPEQRFCVVLDRLDTRGVDLPLAVGVGWFRLPHR